jgi:hypothetical protein
MVVTVNAMVPSTGFLGAQAVDLPFSGWTAFGYSGGTMAMDNPGALFLAKAGTVDKSYGVNALGSIVGVAGAAGTGRLLYTGLSPLSPPPPASPTPPGQPKALYAADLCGTSGLANTMNATCMPVAVSTWGDTTGPIALDGAGNVFAVMPTIKTGMQEARAFPAASIAPGKPATNGVTLFTLPGTGLPLGAIGPTANANGIVAFQPSDINFTPLDVVAQHYTATGGSIQAVGTPATLLKLATSMTGVLLFTDGQSRLWAGVADTTNQKTTFVVIARAQ